MAVTRGEIHTRLIVWPLIDVLDWMGISTLKYIDQDDPLSFSDYHDEMLWLDRHLVCDDEGVLLRVL